MRWIHSSGACFLPSLLSYMSLPGHVAFFWHGNPEPWSGRLLSQLLDMARDVGCCPGDCEGEFKLGLPSFSSPGLWLSPKPRATAIGVLGLVLTSPEGTYDDGYSPQVIHRISRGSIDLLFLFRRLNIPLC